MDNDNLGVRFDRTELLDKVDGEDEVIILLIDSAKNQIPQYINDIRNCLDSAGEDILLCCETMKQDAHAIKGSAFNLCFHRLGYIAKELELLIKERDTSGISRKETFDSCIIIFKQLEEEWQLLLKVIG